MAAPVVQSLDEILAAFQPGYAQQESLIGQQSAALPGQEQAAIGGLETAKSNAFRDINTQANSKGLAFSGMPSEQQTRYVGEKYLPALAGIKNDTSNKQFQLQQALASLGTEKRNRALDTQAGQQRDKDSYDAAELAYQREMQKIMQQQQFDAQQAALSRQASAANNPQTNIQIKKNAAGGWDVIENGKKSSNYDLAAYARLTGANIVSLLANGDAKDRQAAQWYNDKIKKYGTKDQAKYLEELKRDRATAFYLGG